MVKIPCACGQKGCKRGLSINPGKIYFTDGIDEVGLVIVDQDGAGKIIDELETGMLRSHRLVVLHYKSVRPDMQCRILMVDRDGEVYSDTGILPTFTSPYTIVGVEVMGGWTSKRGVVSPEKVDDPDVKRMLEVLKDHD